MTGFRLWCGFRIEFGMAVVLLVERVLDKEPTPDWKGGVARPPLGGPER